MHLREAAETLGVHYQTAYGWVREGVLPARKVGRGYEVSDEDVRALRARRDLGREPAREVRVRDWPAQASRLYAAIAGGEETQARSGLERLAGSVPLADLCQRVIGPALRRIGDDWAAGRVSIAQEHRASAICERLIAIHAQQPAGRPRGIAVVTTPPGERHGLPALMAAACLREDRWLVHHLAADLPAAEITQMAGQVGAGLIVLSCTTDQAVEQAGAVAAEITEAAATVGAAHPPAVLTGGPGDSLLELLQQARDLRAQPAGARTRPRTDHKQPEGPPMASYAATITSARSAADTFAYLAEFSNAAGWDPGVLDAEQVGAGPVTVGTAFRLAVPFLGRRLTLVYQVIRLDPGREVVLRAAGRLLLATDRITVSEDGDRAVVRYEAQVRLRGPLRLVDPLLARGFRAVGDRAAAGLRSALAPVPGHSPRPAA